MKKEKLYYRYRAFNTLTIESLCNDTIYFANPLAFNDPLDCSFTIKCDFEGIDEIKQLYSFLFCRRRNSEIVLSLKNAKVNSERAQEFANKTTNFEVLKKLEEFAYFATDTDSYPSLTAKEAEKDILESEIENEIKKHYTRGVACFSSSYSSLVLWSHYGDEHRGICIGYSVNRKPTPIMQGVNYGGPRSINMSTLINAFLYNNEQDLSGLDKDILLRKAKGWSYEKESRLIGQLGNQNSPLLLTEITFGLRCSDAVKHTILKALEGREQKVNYYEIRKKPNSYLLKREKFHSSEYDCDCNLPITASSPEEEFDSVPFDEI